MVKVDTCNDGATARALNVITWIRNKIMPYERRQEEESNEKVDMFAYSTGNSG